MGILATAARTTDPQEKDRYVGSVKLFANWFSTITLGATAE